MRPRRRALGLGDGDPEGSPTGSATTAVVRTNPVFFIADDVDGDMMDDADFCENT